MKFHAILVLNLSPITHTLTHTHTQTHTTTPGTSRSFLFILGNPTLWYDTFPEIHYCGHSVFPSSVKSLAPPFWKVFNQGFDNFLSVSFSVLSFYFIRYRISLTVSKFSFATCHGFVSVVQFQFFGIVPEFYLPILFMKFLCLYSTFLILVLISKRPLTVLEDIKKFGIVFLVFCLLHYQCFLWIPFFYLFVYFALFDIDYPQILVHIKNSDIKKLIVRCVWGEWV